MWWQLPLTCTIHENIQFLCNSYQDVVTIESFPVSNIVCFCCIYVYSMRITFHMVELHEIISCFQLDGLYWISMFITAMLHVCLWNHSCFCVCVKEVYVGYVRGHWFECPSVGSSFTVGCNVSQKTFLCHKVVFSNHLYTPHWLHLKVHLQFI